MDYNTSIKRNNVLNYLDLSDEDRDRLEKSLPRRRTKPVVCPVTGEENTSIDGLSSRVWHLLHDGTKYKQDVESGNVKTYITLPDNWYNAISAPTTLHFSLKSPHDRLCEMFPDSIRWIDEVSLEKHLYLGRVLLEEGNNAISSLYSKTRYGFELTSREADLARILVNSVMETARLTISAAYRSGQSLLMNIASGNMTIDDVNKLSVKVENLQNKR